MKNLLGIIDRAATPRRIAIALFLFALILRLWFIWESQVLPDIRTPTPGLDICLHWEGAKHIRAGTPDPCFELMPPSAPGHPYFVAFCQSFLGENVLRHRVFRAFIGSLSIVLVFLIGLRLTDRRLVSALSALFVMTLPSWIYFDTMIIKVSVEIFLLCVVLWLLFRDTAGWQPRKFLGLGIVLGILLSLMRFSQGGTVLYVAVIAVFTLVRRNRERINTKLLVAIPMVLLVVGTQFGFKYRQQLFGVPATHFLPVGGVHMRIGFQKNAIGTYHLLRRFPAFPLGHTFFSRMAAEARLGHTLTAAEADQSYIDEAKEFIRENPGETVRILGRKATLFFNNFECAGNHYLPDLQQRTVILNLPTIGYGGLVILAFWGIVALGKQKRRSELLLLGGILLAVLISNLASFVQWRYRLHATVPLALLAGPGMIYLFGVLRTPVIEPQRRGKSMRHLAVVLAVTVVVAYVAFRPVLLFARESMITTAHKNLMHTVQAERFEEEFQQLEAKSGLSIADREKKATLLHRLARYTESFKELEPLATSDPYNALQSARQYVVYLMWYGDYDRVVEYLVWLRSEHPRTFAMLSQSFSSNSMFWHGSDPNLRLITQTLMRDIISPRLGMGTPRVP